MQIAFGLVHGFLLSRLRTSLSWAVSHTYRRFSSTVRFVILCLLLCGSFYVPFPCDDLTLSFSVESGGGGDVSEAAAGDMVAQ